jgi:hypothetical protein
MSADPGFGQEAIAPNPPLWTPVIARALGAVPGALICPDHRALTQVWRRYSRHWEETQQDILTKGQSRLLTGPPRAAPDLGAWGCLLVPPGTPMQLEARAVVPVVTAPGPDGRPFRGVTLNEMYRPAP